MKKHWILILVACLLGSVASAQNDSTLFDVRYIGNTDLISVEQEDGTRQVYRPADPRWDNEPVFSYRYCKGRYQTAGFRRSGLDPYDPFSAGVLSYLMPGLGQLYDGEVLRSAGFFFGTMCCLSVGSVVLSSTHRYEERYDQQYGYYREDVGIGPVDATMGTVFILGGVALWVWNIFDAVKVAKVKDLFFRDLAGRYSAVDLSVRPSIGVVPTSGRPTAGLSLQLHF